MDAFGWYALPCHTADQEHIAFPAFVVDVGNAGIAPRTIREFLSRHNNGNSTPMQAPLFAAVHGYKKLIMKFTDGCITTASCCPSWRVLVPPSLNPRG